MKKVFILLNLSWLSLLLLQQGCIWWFPIDVDYDVEIELDERRPDLNNDIGFIIHGRPYLMWGQELYSEGIQSTGAKIFLLPQQLDDRTRRQPGPEVQSYAEAVRYPDMIGRKSFSEVDLSAFTNSVKDIFNRHYRVKEAWRSNYKLERHYGEDKNPEDESFGFRLRDSSMWLPTNCDEATQNAMMEHSYQALLLRRRFPHVPALRENHEDIKGRMLYTIPRVPLTYIEKLTCAERFELVTEEGRFVGSMTIHYPFYRWTIEGDNGLEMAKKAAMTEFFKLYHDKSRNRAYKGVVTSYIFKKKCKVGLFKALHKAKSQN